MVTAGSEASMTHAPAKGAWRLHLVVGALVGGPLAASVARWVHERLREVTAELQAVATIEELYVDDWLRVRWASAGLSGTSFPEAELYEAWREEGNDVARERLFLRLRQFAEAGGFANVALLDPSFGPVWSAEPPSVELASAVIGKPPEAVLGSDDRDIFPAEEAAAVMANDRSVLRDRAGVTFHETASTASRGTSPSRCTVSAWPRNRRAPWRVTSMSSSASTAPWSTVRSS